MIDNEILEKLALITDEEQAFLDGKNTIDRSVYMSSQNNVINSKNLLEMGKLITIRPHTRFVDFPKHSHDYVEIIYMCKGSTTHIINGNEIVLNEGELLFMNIGASHEIKLAGRDDIAVNFIILPPFFDKALAMLGEEETPLRKFILDCITGTTTGSSYLYFKVADILPIQNLLENLVYTLISNTPNKRQMNQTTMGLLFLQLLNYTERLVVEDKTDATLIEVFRYIEENYKSGSLSDLAKLMHRDFYWLSREIKRKTGKTYTSLLQEKRLSQAAFLLKATKINVSEISETVGYENISYFNRLFYSKYKTSPKKYRDCK